MKFRNIVNIVENTNNSDFVLVCGFRNHFGDNSIINSTCTFHMCPKRDWFTTYKQVNRDTILVGNNMACDLVKIGSIKIKMFDGIVSILSNVWHVPYLRKNILSLGILNSFDYHYSVVSRVI